jgi:predicted amidophosphoribosyltransferase
MLIPVIVLIATSIVYLAALTSNPNCPKCGNKVDPSGKICEKCGFDRS